MASLSLTPDQRAAYERIVSTGTAALARWTATNPMRATVERQVADARKVLAA